MGTCVNHHISLPAACRALGKYPEQGAIHWHIPLLLASSCLPANKIENSLGAYQDLMVSIPGNASVNGKRLAISCSSTVLLAEAKAHPTEIAAPQTFSSMCKSSDTFICLSCLFPSCILTHTVCNFKLYPYIPQRHHSLPLRTHSLKSPIMRFFLLESLFAVTCSSPKVCTVFFVIILSGK